MKKLSFILLTIIVLVVFLQPLAAQTDGSGGEKTITESEETEEPIVDTKPVAKKLDYSESGNYFMKYIAGIGLTAGSHFLKDKYREDVFSPPMLKGGLKFSGAPIPYVVIEFNPWGYYNETSSEDMYGGGFDASVMGKAPTTLPLNPFFGFGISWARIHLEEKGVFSGGKFVSRSGINNHKSDWTGLGWHILMGVEIYATPVAAFVFEATYNSHVLEIQQLEQGSYSWDGDEIPDSYPHDAYSELDLGGWDIRFGMNFHFGPRK